MASRQPTDPRPAELADDERPGADAPACPPDGGRPARGRLRRSRAPRGAPRPHRGDRAAAPRLDPHRRRARTRGGQRRGSPPRPGPSGRSRRRRAPARAPRDPGRAQGPRHPEGARGDGREPHPGGLRRAVRRAYRRAAGRSRRDRRREDEHGRVRDGLLDRALRVRPDAQPVGPDPGPGRLLGWVGRRGRGRACAARDRHRHRRVDPAAGGAHGHGRPQADVRSRQPVRDRRVRLLARPDRAVRARRPRRGAAPRHGRRPRRPRRDLRAASRP